MLKSRRVIWPERGEFFSFFSTYHPGDLKVPYIRPILKVKKLTQDLQKVISGGFIIFSEKSNTSPSLQLCMTLAANVVKDKKEGLEGTLVKRRL